MLTRSKGSWTQFVFICRSHFVGELYSVFCGRFAFCCRSLSLAFLSLDLSYFFIFLVSLSALLFIGLSCSWAFEYGFAKTCINNWLDMIGQHHLIPVDQWSIHLRSCVMRLCEEYAWFVIHHKKEMKKINKKSTRCFQQTHLKTPSLLPTCITSIDYRGKNGPHRKIQLKKLI